MWLLLLMKCLSNYSDMRETELLNIQANITRFEMQKNANWSSSFRFAEKMFHTSQNFLSGEYVSYTGSLPIYVIFGAYSQMNMGNDIGRVINELGCAHIAGLHAIVVHRKFESPFGDESAEAGQKFIEELSTVYVHSSPNTLQVAKDIVHEKCKCNVYCWGESDAPWKDYIQPLRDLFHRAIPAPPLLVHPNPANNIEIAVNSNTELDRAISLTTDPRTGVTAALNGVELHRTPEIAVQLRCSDNTQKMGLVPFPAIFERIDTYFRNKGLTNAKKGSSAPLHHKTNIYIMSEHPARQFGVKKFGSICAHILTTLHIQLSRRYTDSIVSIQRGLMFQTWYQLMHADVVICGASTFCLWPSLANTNGSVYLPLTKVFGNKSVIDFGVPNVKFIEDYEMYDLYSSKSETPEMVITDMMRAPKIEVGKGGGSGSGVEGGRRLKRQHEEEWRKQRRRQEILRARYKEMKARYKEKKARNKERRELRRGVIT
jgi:hypothetical protein